MASKGERRSRVNDLANEVGVTFQALHLVIRTPTSGMHAQTATKVAMAIGVTERWLITGFGQKLRADALSDDEVALLDNYRQLSPELQRTIKHPRR